MSDSEEELGSLDDFGEDERSKPPLFEPAFWRKTRMETGFRRTMRTCLQKLREAMLHHRWRDAAKYMYSYFQALEDTTLSNVLHHKEIILKCGAEILHHFPNAQMEDYNNFYQQMKLLGVSNYLMISLEHVFHLLINGHIEDAKHHLSLAESWRYGRLGQSHTSKLIQAYRGLLDYISWCDIKMSHSENGDADVAASMGEQNHYAKSTMSLKEILKIPGVWDPFVLSYVEMLEYYDHHTEALGVLNNYAYDDSFPANPNAHVYLYRHLKKYRAPESILRRTLKFLQMLVPSHELMLEYCSLLLQTDAEEDVGQALEVSLEMLDYGCWKNNTDAWNCLKAIIAKLKLQSNWKAIVSEKMASRRAWWPAFHFTILQANKDFTDNPDLMDVKASMSGVLCPDMNRSNVGKLTNRKKRKATLKKAHKKTPTKSLKMGLKSRRRRF